MATSPFKNLVVAGTTGTVGATIVKALLRSKQFNISALSRPESKSIMPTGITAPRASMSSHGELVRAFRGQDILICALNDAAAEQQPGIIEAAYEAGVRRIFPNEWASHDLMAEGTGLDQMAAGKVTVVDLLNQKVKHAKAVEREFHCTRINNGVFPLDWTLISTFLYITLPPAQTASFVDGGNNKTTLTSLSVIADTVVAALTHAEVASSDRLPNIQGYAVSQKDIVASLEKLSGEKWDISHTTSNELLRSAVEMMQTGDYQNGFFTWVKIGSLGRDGQLKDWEEGNKILGVSEEDLDAFTIEAITHIRPDHVLLIQNITVNSFHV